MLCLFPFLYSLRSFCYWHIIVTKLPLFICSKLSNSNGPICRWAGPVDTMNPTRLLVELNGNRRRSIWARPHLSTRQLAHRHSEITRFPCQALANKTRQDIESKRAMRPICSVRNKWGFEQDQPSYQNFPPHICIVLSIPMPLEVLSRLLSKSSSNIYTSSVLLFFFPKEGRTPPSPFPYEPCK